MHTHIRIVFFHAQRERERERERELINVSKGTTDFTIDFTIEPADVQKLVNLLRWNDVPRTSRTFCPNIATFFSVLSIFECNPGRTDS